MALLKYKCNQCGHVFEELVFSDKTEVTCPECKSKDIRRAYEGKCLFGKAGSGSGCSGSCSHCSGCH